MVVRYFNRSLNIASGLKRKYSVDTFEKKLEIIEHLKKGKSLRAVFLGRPRIIEAHVSTSECPSLDIVCHA